MRKPAASEGDPREESPLDETPLEKAPFGESPLELSLESSSEESPPGDPAADESPRGERLRRPSLLDEPRLKHSRLKDRSGFSGGARLALALLGVACGIAVAGARFVFPGSAPLLRVESLWQPGLRDVRRGDLALRQGDRAAALRWFNQAVAEGRTPRLKAVILDGIIDASSRQGDWRLEDQFASLSLQQRGRDMDRVRLAQALLGEGKPAAAVSLLNTVLSHRLTNRSARMEWVARLLAERLLALSLARNNNELKRAESLARIGIGEAVRHDVNPDLQGALNDALSWVYYREAATSPAAADRSNNLELARIYGETAVDDLPPAPDPALGATLLYHLSRIDAAEGDTASARREERTALRLAPAAVNALRQEKL